VEFAQTQSTEAEQLTQELDHTLAASFGASLQGFLTATNISLGSKKAARHWRAITTS